MSDVPDPRPLPPEVVLEALKNPNPQNPQTADFPESAKPTDPESAKPTDSRFSFPPSCAFRTQLAEQERTSLSSNHRVSVLLSFLSDADWALSSR
jgi:hypothetical protein